MVKSMKVPDEVVNKIKLGPEKLRRKMTRIVYAREALERGGR